MDRSPRLSSRRLDAIGLALVALLAVWVGVFAGGGEGRPGPVLLLLAGMVAATAIGRLLAGRPGLVPGLVAVSIAGSMVLTWPGVLDAGGPPLGYANGNATLASLGVIAALGAARADPAIAVRRWWLGLAGLLGAFTVLSGSVAGVLALAVALSLLALSAVTRWAGFAIVGGLIALSFTVGVTTAVALGADVLWLGERSETRAELWGAAVDVANERPLRGIGPGVFAEGNPASGDADLRWAHHGYLQAAAEYGVVGLMLVLALIGWIGARLWAVAQQTPAVAALGATVSTVVMLHATVDYIWQLPAVMAVAALLLGAHAGVDP